MKPRPGFDPASLVSGVLVIVLGGLLLLDQADVLDAALRVPAARRVRRGRRHPARLRARRAAARALVGGWEHPRGVRSRDAARAAAAPRPLARVSAASAPGSAAARDRPADPAHRLRRRRRRRRARHRPLRGLLGAAAAGGEGRPLMARAIGRRESWMVASGLVLLMLAVLLLFRAWGIWVGDAVVWPLVLATGGGALIWRQSQGAAVVEQPARERARPGGGAGRPRRGLRLARPSLGIVALGAALVVGAALVFLWLNGALVPDRDVTLAVLVVVTALTLILAPWWLRLDARADGGARRADPHAGARRAGRAPARLRAPDARADAEARRRPARGRGARAAPGARAALVAQRRLAARARRLARRGARGGGGRDRGRARRAGRASSPSATARSTSAARRSSRRRARRS